MNATSLQARFDAAEPFAGSPIAEPVKITASPFRWPDHRNLPRRPWVWGRWLLLSTVSAIVAPGGVGKSSFVASMLLSLASGRRDILGKTVWAGPKRVWYWNLEDGLAELEMQLVAAAMFHRVDRESCGDRIYLDSGPEGAELKIAVEDRDGYRIAIPMVEALVAELIARKIDVLIIDPFVSSHSVGENDNGAIDAVVKTWASIAKRAGCAIVLVHHSKKLGAEKVTAESSRGASALVSAARVTLVLNRMDAAEAQRFGIAEDKERRRLFTVQDDKANRAPAEDAQWFRLASQNVDNATGEDDPYGDEGDSVGVVTRWTPPDAFDGVTTDHLRQVQQAVAAGVWKESSQAKNWVGIAVAEVMGLDPDSNAKADRARINALLRQWIASGALVVVERRCPDKREDKKFVEAGELAIDGIAPPAKGGAGQGGVSGASRAPRPTPPPTGGGVVGQVLAKVIKWGGAIPRWSLLAPYSRLPASLGLSAATSFLRQVKEAMMSNSDSAGEPAGGDVEPVVPKRSAERAANEALVAMKPAFRHSLIGGTIAHSTAGFEEMDWKHSLDAYNAACDDTRGGEMDRASNMLTAQALTLDVVFTEMLSRATKNLGGYPEAMERYMRLALKAQSQSRATLEALINMHRPREQVVRHVHVYEGGQAVVAEELHMHGLGARNAGSDQQPHTQRAPVAALSSPDPLGHAVPISGGSREGTMPDARRGERKRRTGREQQR